MIDLKFSIFKGNMKKIFFALLFFCSVCMSVYIFWVSIDVESPEYNGKAVIETHDLQRYFSKTQNVDNTESRKIMYQILKEKSTLRIEKNGDFAKFDFKIVSSDKAVIAYAQERVNHIVKTNYIRTLGIGGDKAREKYVAISMLYDINIAVRANCESGDFMIYKYDVDARWY